MTTDIWLYCAKFPEGQLCRGIDEAEVEAMLLDGWVDSPARIGEESDPPEIDMEAEIEWMRTSPSRGKPRMVALAACVGAHVDENAAITDMIVAIESAIEASCPSPAAED